MAVLELADAKTYLSITTSSSDEVLGSFIAAAEAAIANKCGPLEPVSRTVRLAPGYALILPRPIATVTSIVDGSGSAVDITDLIVDEQAGVIVIGDGQAFTSRWYDVTYSHGYNPLPEDLLHAVKELVRHLWNTQRGPTSRPGGVTSETTSNTIPGAAYLLPFRVSELIAPYRTMSVS